MKNLFVIVALLGVFGLAKSSGLFVIESVHAVLDGENPKVYSNH
jgi:hypothetical protein